MGSRGSVIPYFQELAKSGQPLPLTDLRMTRFWISIEQAVHFVMDSFDVMTGGELYVPRIPSMKLIDLARAISPNAEVKEIGMRPGEKLHEEMISLDDSRRTLLLGTRHVVMPVVAEWGYVAPKGKAMLEDKAYRSDTNDLWLSVEDIRSCLKQI
jgi:UDP-N-acetylglucosamine 4,6-dehydratase